MFQKLTSFNCGPGRSSLGGGSSNSYPRPYLDFTSPHVPQTFSEMIDWSEYAYLATGDYKALFERLFGYFITELQVSSINPLRDAVDDTKRTDWKRLLERDLNWPVEAGAILSDVAVYGNAFITLHTPIIRFLECPRCGLRLEFRKYASDHRVQFRRVKSKFVGLCFSESCQRQHGRDLLPLIVHDMRSTRPKDFRVRRWPVRDIVMHHYYWSDRTRIFWRIPEHYKQAVRNNDVETLSEADDQVLKAIDENKLFEFREDRIVHLKEPTISGLHTRGWGIPRSLFLHRQGWTVQLLRKQTQSVALDWVTPIKLLAPSTAPTVAGGGQPIQTSAHTTTPFPDFARMVRGVVNSHQNNPTGWHPIPSAVEPHILGGNADQLFPRDLMQYAKEEFVDAGGFPVEMYKGTLTLQAAPVGLRLFEATHRGIGAMLNTAIAFVANRISELSGWDPVDVQHKRVTVVDDLELLMAHLQMATSGSVAMSPILERMNIDFREDVMQQAKEQKIREEIQLRAQEEAMKRQQAMQAMQPPPQQGGDPSQGGDPAAADPYAGMLPSTGLVVPTLPDQMEQAATSLAMTLAQMDPQSRQNEIAIIRQQNPTFHAIVMQRLEQQDNAMAQQGRQMLISGQMG